MSGRWSTGLDMLLVQVCVCVCACTHLPVLSFLEGNALKHLLLNTSNFLDHAGCPSKSCKQISRRIAGACKPQPSSMINLVCEKHSLAPCWVTVVSMPQHTIHSVYPKHLGEKFVDSQTTDKPIAKGHQGGFLSWRATHF